MTVPAINALHLVIATGIVLHAEGMTGEELRFLRTEMGMTQSELATLLHRDKQSVGRWERGEIEFDSASETLTRKLAIERLELEVDLPIAELSARSVQGAAVQPIEIDRVESANDDAASYRLRAA